MKYSKKLNKDIYQRFKKYIISNSCISDDRCLITYFTDDIDVNICFNDKDFIINICDTYQNISQNKINIWVLNMILKCYKDDYVNDRKYNFYINNIETNFSIC
jgi:hypothetical protein